MDLSTVEEWLAQHETLLTWVGVGSFAGLLGSLLLVPPLVARVPVDYFAHATRKELRQGPRSVAGVLLLALRNVIGVVLIVVGLAMLVLPGPGTVTILFGIVLMDFPGKYRLERAIVLRPPVLRRLNAIRRRAGRPPLEVHAEPR